MANWLTHCFVRWNFKGGFRQTPGAEKWNTWPEYFKKHGYYTKGCGKITQPRDPADFDPQSWTGNKYSGYNGQGSCPLKNLEGKNKSHGCPVPASLNYTGYPDYKTLATAKELLQNATLADQQARARTDGQSGQPFWIGVGFVKPHMPHVFPEEFLDVVPQTADIEIATNQYMPKGTPFIEWGSGYEVPASGPNSPPDQWTAQDWRRNYYAAAAFSDHLLGELLAELESLGKANDTIIIMTADRESCSSVLWHSRIPL